MNKQLDREQFERTLRPYVTGRLDDSGRAWMDRFVSEHPEAAAEIELERALQEVLREGLPEAAPDQGLEQFMARLHAETASPREPAPAASSESLWSRFTEDLVGIWMRPAWAAMALLLIAQSGMITFLWRNGSADHPPGMDQPFERWRSPAATAPMRGPLLRLTFKPTATEAEIRLLLIRNRGQIVAGPGQLGHYYVKVSTENLNATAQSLQGNEILESVDIQTELPKEE